MKDAKLIIRVDANQQNMETGEATWQNFIIEWDIKPDGTCKSLECGDRWAAVQQFFGVHLIPRPEVMFVD